MEVEIDVLSYLEADSPAGAEIKDLRSLRKLSTRGELLLKYKRNQLRRSGFLVLRCSETVA